MQRENLSYPTGGQRTTEPKNVGGINPVVGSQPKDAQDKPLAIRHSHAIISLECQTEYERWIKMTLRRR